VAEDGEGVASEASEWEDREREEQLAVAGEGREALVGGGGRVGERRFPSVTP